MRVFNHVTASAFFDRVHVPLILMEWKFHKASKKPCEVDAWLEFFYRRNYSVHHGSSRARLGRDWRKWTDDVFFMLRQLL